jgi:hypothetical protein
MFFSIVAPNWIVILRRAPFARRKPGLSAAEGDLSEPREFLGACPERAERPKGAFGSLPYCRIAALLHPHRFSHTLRPPHPSAKAKGRGGVPLLLVKTPDYQRSLLQPTCHFERSGTAALRQFRAVEKPAFSPPGNTKPPPDPKSVEAQPHKMARLNLQAATSRSQSKSTKSKVPIPKMGIPRCQNPEPLGPIMGAQSVRQDA